MRTLVLLRDVTCKKYGVSEINITTTWGLVTIMRGIRLPIIAVSLKHKISTQMLVIRKMGKHSLLFSGVTWGRVIGIKCGSQLQR